MKNHILAYSQNKNSLRAVFVMNLHRYTLTSFVIEIAFVVVDENDYCCAITRLFFSFNQPFNKFTVRLSIAVGIADKIGVPDINPFPSTIQGHLLSYVRSDFLFLKYSRTPKKGTTTSAN